MRTQLDFWPCRTGLMTSCGGLAKNITSKQVMEFTWKSCATVNVLQFQGTTAICLLESIIEVSSFLQPLVLLLDIVENLL